MTYFVKFWGTRGSIPTPGYRTQIYGGNTPCVELRIDDVIYICDGGSGLRELGLDLLQRDLPAIEGHLFFSHAHWDHIQGFPFFVPAYVPSNRFVVYGTQRGDTKFHGLLSGQMESDYFPVDFSDLGANIEPDDLGDGGKEIAGVRVTCIPQIHHGPSYGYAFERGGYKVVYATDNELDQELANREAVAADPTIPRQVPQRFVDFARGADLLIADGQYTDSEYASKVGFGHPRATTLVDLAVQAGVAQLAVTHHDPLQSDEAVERKIAACRQRLEQLGGELVVFGAREGMELRID
jgi:phosphoribosyl 1,2-cyclic phosphodiesterase